MNRWFPGGLIYGVPVEVAAFAAGIETGGCKHWKVIAAVIETAGLGVFEMTTLEMAARDWTRATTHRPDDVGAKVAAACDRLKGSKPSQ